MIGRTPEILPVTDSTRLFLNALVEIAEILGIGGGGVSLGLVEI